MKKYRLTLLGKYIIFLFSVFMVVVILSLCLIFSHYQNELKKLKTLNDVKPTVISDQTKTLIKPTPTPDASAASAGTNKAIANLLKVSIFFEPDRAVVGEQYFSSLDVFGQAAKTLKDYSVVIEGNCATLAENPQSKNIADYNNRLSLQRAQAVAQYLKQNGLSQERIEVISNGSQKPLKDNKTPEGRKLNRRSDIYFKQNN